MSDGGNRLVQSVKCRAVLTTPDPIKKVIGFCQEARHATRRDPAEHQGRGCGSRR